MWSCRKIFIILGTVCMGVGGIYMGRKIYNKYWKSKRYDNFTSNTFVEESQTNQSNKSHESESDESNQLESHESNQLESNESDESESNESESNESDESESNESNQLESDESHESHESESDESNHHTTDLTISKVLTPDEHNMMTGGTILL